MSGHLASVELAVPIAIGTNDSAVRFTDTNPRFTDKSPSYA